MILRASIFVVLSFYLNQTYVFGNEPFEDFLDNSGTDTWRETLHQRLQDVMLIDDSILFNDEGELIHESDLDKRARELNPLNDTLNEIKKIFGSNNRNEASLEFLTWLNKSYSGLDPFHRERALWLVGMLPKFLDGQDLLSYTTQEITRFLFKVIEGQDKSIKLSDAHATKEFGIKVRALLSLANLSSALPPASLTETVGQVVSLISCLEDQLKNTDDVLQKNQIQLQLRLLFAIRLLGSRHSIALLNLIGNFFSVPTHISMDAQEHLVLMMATVVKSLIEAPQIKQWLYHYKQHEEESKKSGQRVELTIAEFEDAMKLLKPFWEAQEEEKILHVLKDVWAHSKQQLIKEQVVIEKTKRDLVRGLTTLEDAIILLARSEVLFKRQMDHSHFRQLIGDRDVDQLGLFFLFDAARGGLINDRFSMYEDRRLSLNFYPRAGDSEILTQKATRDWNFVRSALLALGLEVRPKNVEQVIRIKNIITTSMKSVGEEIRSHLFAASLTWERPTAVLPDETVRFVIGLRGLDLTQQFKIQRVPMSSGRLPKR